MKHIIAAGVFLCLPYTALSSDTPNHPNSLTEAPKGLYLGGGVSYNDLDIGSVFNGANDETALGFQLFAGIPVANSLEGFETFAEAGYFQTDSFKFAPGVKEKVTGIWGAGVLQRNLNEVDPNLYGLARIGLEIGDDDGIFMGIGAGYRISTKADIRAEFLNKDLISSYQLNALIRF